MKSVIDRIDKVFRNAKVDAIVLINTETQDSNFLYLTGFTSGVFEDTILIVTKSRLIMPTNMLEYDIAREQRPKEMLVLKVESREVYKKMLTKYLKNKVVGINGDFLPYSYYKRIRKYSKKLVDVSGAFRSAREIKAEDEISNIRKANGITKIALKEIQKYFKTGITEKELAAQFDYLMMKHGANGAAFPSIVAFDKNTALPHHMPDDTKLTSNSLVLLDVGAKYNNYCSDLTRTFIFKPDKKSDRYRTMLEIYSIVKGAQKLALKNIRPGVDGSRVYTEIVNYINSAGGGKYKNRFIHGLGHSIGIEVHDPGTGLGARKKSFLKENMIFSDEPGIYLYGFGGVRIEDDVLVTKNGAVFL